MAQGHDAQDAKPALRGEALARRKAAFARLGPAPMAATQNLRDAIGAVRGQIIAAYFPIRDEISPLDAARDLAADNQLCLPVVAARDQALIFRPWKMDAPLTRGAFGTMIPEGGADVTPDIVIVPLVAFDASGHRLGYGGGYYDRSLAALRARGALRAIGLAYGDQYCPDLPTLPTDQRLDAIVTETRILWPR